MCHHSDGAAEAAPEAKLVSSSLNSNTLLSSKDSSSIDRYTSASQPESTGNSALDHILGNDTSGLLKDDFAWVNYDMNNVSADARSLADNAKNHGDTQSYEQELFADLHDLRSDVRTMRQDLRDSGQDPSGDASRELRHQYRDLVHSIKEQIRAAFHSADGSGSGDGGSTQPGDGGGSTQPGDGGGSTQTGDGGGSTQPGDGGGSTQPGDGGGSTQTGDGGGSTQPGDGGGTQPVEGTGATADWAQKFGLPAIPASFTQPGSGKVYYVDASAAGDGSGAQGSPFRTIQEAANLVQPGDTVYVAPGVYNENVKLTTSGTQDAPIKFVSEQQGGAQISAGSGYVFEGDASNLQVVGFDVNGQGTATGGVQLWGSDNAVVGCVAHDFRSSKDSMGGAGIFAGYYPDSASDASNTGKNELIYGNLVYNVGDPNGGGSTTQGIYMGSEGTISNNVVYHAEDAGISLWHADTNNKVTNNLVFDSAIGVAIGGGDAPWQGAIGPSNSVIENNVLINNLKDGIWEGGTIGDGNIIRNNVISGTPTDVAMNGSQQIVAEGTTHEAANSLYANFAADGSGDYHLQASSDAYASHYGPSFVGDTAVVPATGGHTTPDGGITTPDGGVTTPDGGDGNINGGTPTAGGSEWFPNAAWLHSPPQGQAIDISSQTAGLTFNLNSTNGWNYPVQEADGSNGYTTFSDGGKTITVPNPADGFHPAYQDDGHLIVVDRKAGKYYDFWQLRADSNGNPTSTHVGRIEEGSLSGDGTPGTTAANVTGLAGVVFENELSSPNGINHALILGVPPELASNLLGTQGPAGLNATDGAVSGGLLREGSKISISPDVNVDALPVSTAVKAIMHALQKYGGLIVDRAGAMAFYGAQMSHEPDLTGINEIGKYLRVTV